jgi:competence protein ComFC
LCRGCRSRIARAPERPPPPQVDRLVVPWRYDGAARSLILNLKLKGQRVAAEPLVEALAGEIARRGLKGTMLTWVPARRRDATGRGFDHAEILARALAGRLGLVAAGVLIRRAGRLDQASLPAAKRWANLKGAFYARTCPEDVVLVDDLVTTGATAGCCAHALRAAGATGVEVAAVCVA